MEFCVLIINSSKYGKFEILYSKEDQQLVLSKNWHVKKEYRTTDCFYVMTNIKTETKRTAVSLHRFLKPEWKMIDHINGNPLDNRRENLRETTYSENCKNKTKRKTNSSSKYKGVYKRGNKWAAAVMNNYEKHYLGVFNTEDEAALAYNEKVKELNCEFTKLNTISRS